jgi:hypothetical protein
MNTFAVVGEFCTSGSLWHVSDYSVCCPPSSPLFPSLSLSAHPPPCLHPERSSALLSSLFPASSCSLLPLPLSSCPRPNAFCTASDVCACTRKPTHRPKRYSAFASTAATSEYTIIPFQKGKGDFVTCANISCET